MLTGDGEDGSPKLILFPLYYQWLNLVPEIKLKWRDPIISIWIGFLECKANLDSKKGGQMIAPKETLIFKRARELKNKQ